MKRREQLKPHIQSSYARYLTKPPEGASAWLYGRNLTEAARNCELEKKLGSKLLKPKGGQQTQSAGGAQQQQKRQGQGGPRQGKRFRHAGNWGDQQFRQYTPRTYGYNHYQWGFPNPQQFQTCRQPSQKQETQGAQHQPRQVFQQVGARK